jgi:hypothetical protein
MKINIDKKIGQLKILRIWTHVYFIDGQPDVGSSED